jgi:hypothetical protein
MDNIDDKTFEMILSLVRQATGENPSRVSMIIDSATKGVKDFAHKERGTSSLLANLLIEEVLDGKKFFSNEQKLAVLYRYFGSAPIFKEVAQHYNVTDDWKPTKDLLDSITN